MTLRLRLMRLAGQMVGTVLAIGVAVRVTMDPAAHVTTVVVAATQLLDAALQRLSSSLDLPTARQPRWSERQRCCRPARPLDDSGVP